MTSIMSLPYYMNGFLHELGPSSGVYSFVSYPSAIQPNPRSKCRQDPYTNGTSDKRNVRVNNNFAQRVPLRNIVTSTADPGDFRPRDVERRAYLKKRVLPHIEGRRKPIVGIKFNDNSDSSSPSPPAQTNSDEKLVARRARLGKRLFRIPGVERRKHRQIQTETLTNQNGRQEADVAVQTDGIWIADETLEETVQPTCVDKSTQILLDDPDLFIFDKEVTIVLEAIVGKTLEQGVLEVIEEEELASIAKQKITNQHKMLMLKFS